MDEIARDERNGAPAPPSPFLTASATLLSARAARASFVVADSGSQSTKAAAAKISYGERNALASTTIARPLPASACLQPRSENPICRVVPANLTTISGGSRTFRTATMNTARLYVERRPQGDYAVRKANSERASAVERTQAKAIARAREMNPGKQPVVARVRYTSTGYPDQWRKA